MLRSDTILNLIHIWSTLFVCLDEKPFFATNHFLLNLLMVTEMLMGLLRNTNDFFCCFQESTCVKVQQWSAY